MSESKPSAPDTTGNLFGTTPSGGLSVHQAVLVAIMSSVLSSLGVGGGVTAFRDSSVTKTQIELQELRADVKALRAKVEEVYEIVDKAHPRTGLNP